MRLVYVYAWPADFSLYSSVRTILRLALSSHHTPSCVRDRPNIYVGVK
jgi:hypothetical protein